MGKIIDFISFIVKPSYSPILLYRYLLVFPLLTSPIGEEIEISPPDLPHWGGTKNFPHLTSPQRGGIKYSLPCLHHRGGNYKLKRLGQVAQVFLISRRWIRTTVKRARIFRPATRRSGIIQFSYGAGDETRTRDLLLGKETFYH